MSFPSQSQVEFTTPKNHELEALNMASQIAKATYKEEAFQQMLRSLRLLQVYFESHPDPVALRVVTTSIAIAEDAQKP